MKNLMLLALFSFGCSGQPTETMDASNGADVADAGGLDTGAERDAEDLGADAEADVLALDPCATGVLWEVADTPPIPARDHHATFITTRGTPTLHVVGGTDYANIFADHWQAPILEDGSIGTWEEGVPLPGPRGGHAVATTGRDVWLIAGRNTGQMVTTVTRATFDDDGTIDGWLVEAPIPEARFHAAAAYDGSSIWLTGGLQQDGSAQNSVYRAVLVDDEVANWESFTLPEPRSHHGAFAYGGFVYMGLGFSGNAFMDDTTAHHDLVKFAANSTPGELALESVATLREDVSTMAMTVTGNCVRTAGGLTFVEDTGDYRYQNASWKLMLDDAAPEFVEQARQNTGRSHMHQAPYYNGVFYAFGGSESYQNVGNTLEIGRVQ